MKVTRKRLNRWRDVFNQRGDVVQYRMIKEIIVKYPFGFIVTQETIDSLMSGGVDFVLLCDVILTRKQKSICLATCMCFDYQLKLQNEDKFTGGKVHPNYAAEYLKIYRKACAALLVSTLEDSET